MAEQASQARHSQREVLCRGDRYDVHEELSRLPQTRAQLKDWLFLTHNLPERSAYREIERHCSDGCVGPFSDTDGHDKRLRNFGETELDHNVRREVLKYCNSQSVPEWFQEAEYYLPRVAVNLGLPPSKIESSFYRVVKSVKTEWASTGQVPKPLGKSSGDG